MIELCYMLAHQMAAPNSPSGLIRGSIMPMDSLDLHKGIFR